MSVFALIVAGRMVQTNFTALKEMEYMIEILDAESINHLVIFLTGLEPLPANYGGSIYISWTAIDGGERQWNYLGFISNEKPSALFKIGQLNKRTQTNPQNFAFHASNINASSNFLNNSASHSALLGIKVEQMIEIVRRNEYEDTSTNEQLSSIAQFPEKMLRNFVNFMHSFAVSFPKPNGGQEEYIPARNVTEWFTNFRRKLEANPNFWKSLP